MGKTGPPRGAMNHLTNGARVGKKQRLIIGNLPPKMSAVKREATKYRLTLEQAVMEKKGKISLTDAHWIDAATQSTMASAIARWLLRNRLDEMKVSDLLICNKMAARHKHERAAIVKSLDLDAPEPEESLDDVIEAEYTTKRIEDQR